MTLLTLLAGWGVLSGVVMALVYAHGERELQREVAQ